MIYLILFCVVVVAGLWIYSLIRVGSKNDLHLPRTK